MANTGFAAPGHWETLTRSDQVNPKYKVSSRPIKLNRSLLLAGNGHYLGTLESPDPGTSVEVLLASRMFTPADIGAPVTNETAIEIQVRLPRAMNVPEVYYARGGDISNYHVASLAFFKETFDLRVQVLPDEEARYFWHHYSVSQQGGKLAKVEIRMRPDHTPSVVQQCWPFVGSGSSVGSHPGVSAHQLFWDNDYLPHIFTQERRWTLIIPFAGIGNVRKALHFMNHAGVQTPFANLKQVPTPVTWNREVFDRILAPGAMGRAKIAPTAPYFDSADDAALATMFASGADVNYLYPEVIALRSHALPAKFVQASPADRDGICQSYVAVFKFPDEQYPDVWRDLIQIGTPIHVCFAPPPTGSIAVPTLDGGEKKKKRDSLFWAGCIVDPAPFFPDNLAIHVRRNVAAPGGSSEKAALAGMPIPLQPKFSTTIPTTKCFLKFTDFAKPNRRRFAATSLLLERNIQSLTALPTSQPPACADLLDNDDDSDADSNASADVAPVAADDDTDWDEAAKFDDELNGNLAGFGDDAATLVRHRRGMQGIFAAKNVHDYFEKNLLDDIPPTVLAKVEASLGPVWYEFEQFLHRVPCGVLLMKGPPGTGKTFVLARIIALQLARGEKVLATGPSNEAVDHLCNAVDAAMLAAGVTGMRIRAYPLDQEVRALMRFAARRNAQPWNVAPDTHWDVLSHWKAAHSTAEWALKLIGVVAPGVGDLPFPELQSYPSFRAFRTAMLKDPQDRTEEERMSLRSWCQDVCKLLRHTTNMLCATTFTAWDLDLRQFTISATVIVVDEVSQTTPSDIPIIWRNFQTLILAGDEMQLSSVVKSERLEKKDGPVNVLALMDKISLHSRLMSAGWPVMALRVQRRMVPGMGHLVRDLRYRELHMTDHNKPGGLPALARGFEQWAVRCGCRPSPNGQVFPVFVHVPNTICNRIGPTKSRTNSDMHVATKHILNDLEGFLHVGSDAFCILTPYKAMLAEMERDPGPHRNVLCGTVDGLQGQEREIILANLVVNAKTGAGFVADEKRLTVLLSRHRQGLVIIGDRNTMDNRDVTEMDPRADEGRRDPIRPSGKKPMMQEMMEWLAARGRVANYTSILGRH
ncbi:P-loop containing nucleoside triphosphate hydrolase protein [Hypomontagnella monticulosa]|nr:P-loop containing nucleoside triphosphate hydrolase protein [Hypomontagnella monticulosa]